MEVVICLSFVGRKSIPRRWDWVVYLLLESVTVACVTIHPVGTDRPLRARARCTAVGQPSRWTLTRLCDRADVRLALFKRSVGHCWSRDNGRYRHARAFRRRKRQIQRHSPSGLHALRRPRTTGTVLKPSPGRLHPFLALPVSLSLCPCEPPHNRGVGPREDTGLIRVHPLVAPGPTAGGVGNTAEGGHTALPVVHQGCPGQVVCSLTRRRPVLSSVRLVQPRWRASRGRWL